MERSPPVACTQTAIRDMIPGDWSPLSARLRSRVLEGSCPMVECELVRIVMRETTDQQYIYLREKEGDRTFPILIGVAEASEINRKAIGLSTRRPLTHDLLRTVVGELGGALEGIEVYDLRESTFFAHLVLRQGDRILRVDCRPSDAIALAVAESVPIRVAESVLNVAAPPPDANEAAG